MIASLDLVIAKPKKYLNKPFLYYLLNTRLFHEHAIAYSNGTTVIHLSKKAIPEFTFVIPDATTLKNFKLIINPIFEKIRTNELQIQTLQKTRDLLLPKLMTGKIRVPVEVEK